MTRIVLVLYDQCLIDDTVVYWTWEEIEYPKRLDKLLIYNSTLSVDSFIDVSKVLVDE